MADSEAQARNIEAAQTSPQGDAVNHPPHYNHGGKETIDYIESLGIGFEFCVGNAIKYLSRAGYKDDIVQDLRKALWYIDRARVYTQHQRITSYFLERVQVCVENCFGFGKDISSLKAEDLVDNSGIDEVSPILFTELLGMAVKCWKGGM